MGPLVWASGGYVPDDEAVAAPGEAAVGEQGHLSRQPLAGDGRSGSEHLTHAGTALGALRSG
jgi:hypothetical protein